MSKRTSWALVVAVAAIILWLLADYGLPSQEICEPAKQVGQEQCAAYGFPLFLAIQIGEFLDRHNGLIIAAFTGTLWWSTFMLWKAGERQLAHSEDSAQRQLRAYLTLENFGLDFDKAGEDTTARPFAAWKNGGQTPATDQTGGFNWDLFDGELPADFGFHDHPDDTAESSFVVGPRVAFSVSCERLLTIHDFFEVAANRKRLFAWSWVEYRDVFGVKRRTEAAAEVRAIKLKNGEHNIRFESLGRFNAMDADCMRQPTEG